MEAPMYLINKGKKAASAYVHEECCRSGTPRQLYELLDYFLDPRKKIGELEALEWCRWLLAGGRTPDEFYATVRQYDNATTCGLVWTANFVAYRCRTCGISPCMSLCASCFQQGNHEGHDFNMFRSQAGGACDCGDMNVMKESGFCHQHGPKAGPDKPAVPNDLLCVAEFVFPRLILRLVQYLRERSTSDGSEAHLNSIMDADDFLTMLHQLSQLGAAMRLVITQTLINPQIYKNLTDVQLEDSELQSHVNESLKKYTEALESYKANDYSSPPDNLILQTKLIHRTFLDECVFWTVVYEFPQKLVCVLLNMLPDNTYKEAFTRAFVRHYSRISMMLVKAKEYDTLSNRVVHVSVQLFSNEALALKMAEELHLLHVMVISLKDMMQKILIPSTLHIPEKNLHFVVDCNKHVMKAHCYWSLVSDLINVLSHKPIVLMFLKDDSLLEMWFNFLAMFQGMNANKRELQQHVKFEQNTYYAAFSAELEASAAVMWAMIAHLKDESTEQLTKRVLMYCTNGLQDWFDALGFPTTYKEDPLQVSFHLPLHRYFSVFVNQAVRYQGVKLRDILPSETMLENIMVHPLKAQVAFYEILSGMWVRNGLQIKGQAMTYLQCHFCNSMVDADMFLLQLCAGHLDPDTFVYNVLNRFNIWNWLSFDPEVSRKLFFTESEHLMPIVEGCLTFFASLLSIHTNIGPQDDLTKQEMVTLLCMGDKTHSQLMDLMPEKCGSVLQNKDFEATLQRVADYKAPNFEAGGNMLQGMYMPKPEIWEFDYDPIFVLLRSVHRRDFQASMDRFTNFVRQNGKFTGTKTLWPPYRIPGPIHPSYVDPRNILHCRTMQGVLFTILYKAVHDPTVSEMVMSLCIYLLDMAVRFPAEENISGKELLHFGVACDEQTVDLQFLEWFNSNFILSNLPHTISKIILPNSGSMNMEVDHYQGPDVECEDVASIVETPTDEVALDTPLVSEQVTQPSTPSTSQALVPFSDSNMVVVQSTPQHIDIPTSTSQTVAIRSRNLTQTKRSFLRKIPLAIYPPMPLALVLRPEASIQPTMRAITNQDSSASECNMELDALPSSQSNCVEVNESMLSLLLKLHSKLSSRPGSYVPLNERPEAQQPNSSGYESRIGDGAHFIGLLLDKICQMSIRNIRAMQKIRDQLWPKRPTDAESSSSASDREERRRKAKERQQRLMAEFASQQRAFMEKSRGIVITEEPSSSNSSTADSASESVYQYSKEYDCVICGQSSPSTNSKPLGLVCLLQASSVLGFSSCDSSPLSMPCTEEDVNLLRTKQRRKVFMKTRIEELGRNFDDISRLMSVNIGWEGGVYVRTCGHHLHLDCHESYIKSLQQNQHTQRQPNHAADKGEYFCPLCRQLANTVLPIAPDIIEIAAVVKSVPGDSPTVAAELLQLINSDPPIPQKTNLMRAMSNIIKDMTNVTQNKHCSSSQCLESVFLFISSVARTNLELEIVLRGGNLCKHPSNTLPKPCFVPLLHVLSTHTKVLPVKRLSQIWPQITGLQLDDNLTSLICCENEVPLLLKDISALLLQFILTLPMQMDKSYFTCIVRMLFNIVYVQSAAVLSTRMSEEERLRWKELGKAEEYQPLSSLPSLLGEVIDSLEHCALYLQDDDMDRSTRVKRWTASELEIELKRMCMPFIRIAALLQHHIFEEDLNASDAQDEFDFLSNYLALDTYRAILSTGDVDTSSASCLTWIAPDARVVVQNWCKELIVFVHTAQIASRNLLDQHITWFQPRLLTLPPNYDQIFQFYHQRPCSCCNSVPKEPSVCLACGTLVCMRDNCCRQHTVAEAVQHSISCGAGTAMYLAVNSSTIVVIRGKRACLWGSVYLDHFGEEDRDLKRGKPLYLSMDRYRLLEHQWLNHCFDHTSKRWIWHKDNL